MLTPGLRGDLAPGPVSAQVSEVTISRASLYVRYTLRVIIIL